jgi:hypothetical protein
MKTGSKLKPYNLLLAAQNPQNPQSKLLDQEIKVKTKTKQTKIFTGYSLQQKLTKP